LHICDWAIPRRKLIWELGQLSDLPGGKNLKFSDEGINLDSMSPAEREILGLLADNHIISLYRDWMTRKGILGSRELTSRRDGQVVRVAGQNVMDQAPPTAKGYHFVTLEDENGFVNVIVRPSVYARYRRVIRNTPVLLVEGRLQREDRVINVLCERTESLRLI
jgi:error-prone DNA polymerase